MVEPIDTTLTKIFVGGLPYHTTDEGLRQYFQQFGDIDEAVVITDRQTNKSRGYGFVTMADRSAAERACKDPNPIIDGRKTNVNLAYLGAKPRIFPGRTLPASFPLTTKINGLQAANFITSPPPCPSASTPAVFYPSAPATGAVVDPTSLSNVVYYDPVSGGIFSALPGLPGYDVTNSAYLYGGGGVGLPLVPSAGYGLPGRAGSAAGQSLTMLTQQPHYVQRLA